MARFKLTPAVMAMNRLGDCWIHDLENRDIELRKFSHVKTAWDDFTVWLESDIKRFHPDKFDLYLERMLPRFETFQGWFYWQRSRIVNIETMDRLERADALFRNKYLSSPEAVEDPDRIDKGAR